MHVYNVPQDATSIRPFRTHNDELYLYETVTWDSDQWSQCELWLRRLNKTGQLCKEPVGYGLDLLDRQGDILDTFYVTRPGFIYLRNHWHFRRWRDLDTGHWYQQQ